MVAVCRRSRRTRSQALRVHSHSRSYLSPPQPVRTTVAADFLVRIAWYLFVSDSSNPPHPTAPSRGRRFGNRRPGNSPPSGPPSHLCRSRTSVLLRNAVGTWIPPPMRAERPRNWPRPHTPPHQLRSSFGARPRARRRGLLSHSRHRVARPTTVKPTWLVARTVSTARRTSQWYGTFIVLV